MTVTEINAAKFKDMVRVAAHRLSNNAEFVNSLNVFPVPDGDTGTNMSLSFQSGAKEVNDSNADSVGALAQCLAKGLLMGARGNSGVISSQLFRGFAKRVEKLSTLTAQDLVNGFVGGVETAYKAVMKPVEGTILTVAREAAKAGIKTASKTDDISVVMRAIVDGARAALKTTPDLLPVLKEVGVVDSGGQGLVFIYEGFLEGLTGEKSKDIHTPSQSEMDEMVNATHHQSVQSQLDTKDIKNGFCTEMMIKLGPTPQFQKFNYEEFRNHLSNLGDSLLAVADDEVVKVHVHTEHPGLVWAYGQQFGTLSKIKIDNMRLQHETIIENDEPDMKPAAPIDYGIIAIAAGDGLAQIFKSLGVTYVLNGGQTMNPSTKDILDAITALNAKRVIVLPNNGNILMAAQQAAQAADMPVAIVPSKTISQGMTAMFAFNPDNDLGTNEAEMTDALATVTSGQITQAIRDTTINGMTIKKDDFMGIINGDIAVAAPDRQQVTIDTLNKMIDEDSEVITILVGGDGSMAEAEAIKAAVLAEHDDMEAEIHRGDQPVYAYLLSVE
ncbi:MAG: DAK2 domain-containing protein [Candidatus Paralactobacillus gallistercoris]|uniref:DAK2 domain-containing protein n=1 Tax=Candidatus Paralactobacillus gallistercoris TaxID=2838724 RepID=A0A948TK32_9LACO|nr:DAK2 domain-containing protein [Candidatus Paralactobacillus gallistercoris]